MVKPSATDLDNAGVDLQTISDVANSTQDTTTTRLSGTIKTLTGVIKTAKVYGAPTAYNSGTTYTTAQETVTQAGTVFAPNPDDLPIGPETFDSSHWNVLQGHIPGTELDQSGADIINIGNDLEQEGTAPNFSQTNTDAALVNDQVIGGWEVTNSDISGGGVGISAIRNKSQNSSGSATYWELTVKTATGIDVPAAGFNETGELENTVYGYTRFINGRSTPVVNINNPALYRSDGTGGTLPFTVAGSMVYEGMDGSAGHYFLGGSSQKVRLVIEGSGSIGIGTDNPDKLVHLVDETLGKTGNPLNADSLLVLDKNIDDNNYMEFTGPGAMTSAQGFVFSDNANQRGRLLYVHSAEQFQFWASGAEQLNLNNARLAPETTEVYDLGSASKEFDNVFTQNAVTVSDANRKDDEGAVKGSPYVQLMKNLSPRIFTFKDKVVQKAVPAIMGKRQAVDEIDAIKIEYVENEGTGEFDEIEVPCKHRIKRFEKIKIRKDGKLKKRKNKETGEMEQVYFDKPVMEEYEKELAIEQRIVTHSRPHTGHMAQAVKAEMNAIDPDFDWAGYAVYNEGENDETHALRYNEFIAPMLAYIQEVDTENQSLKTIINDLISRIEVLEP
jgi:hypothetical protein